jgi:ELWxxDGT repeat protein
MGEELYKTDGTEAGTQLVKDINAGAAGSTPRLLTNVNGTLYFSATNGSVGTLLWKSDGTDAGTVIVKNILEGFVSASFNSMIPDPVNNRLFFRALVNGVFNLWKSDGTSEGTQIIALTGNADPNPNPNNITVAGNRTFFTALATGVTGTELYCTNAEATSATLVKDINSGTTSSTITTMAAIGNKVVFHANSLQYGIEPWVSDGTELGTSLLKDLKALTNSSTPSNLVDINGTLFFTAADGDVNNNELWKSDGTPEGTVLVKDILPGLNGSNPASFCTINSILYFSARNTLNNDELWRSDGTEAGTYLVKEIIPGESSGSSPVKLTSMNGILYFVANHPDFGTELTRSDGTAEGTYIVKDIRPGSTTIFVGNMAIIAMGNTLFFAFSDGTNGTELWKSDGTTEGTVLVKDINPGSASGSPAEFYNANGILFFRANDGVNGNELWKTDGTEAGTVMVKDVFAGSGNGNPQQFVGFDNSLVFWGPGGLWKSDGTETGTIKMVDVTGNIASLTNAAGTLFFAGGPNTILMKSNLTQEGTKTILNAPAGTGVNSGVPMTNSSLIYAVGSTVYLRSGSIPKGFTDHPGFELWKVVNASDTGIFINDMYPGSGNGNPGNFALSNGNLFFSASNSEIGIELYKISVGGGLPAITTWTGAISTAWEDAGNWTNGIPGAITAVTIQGGMPRYPVISADISIKSLSIQNSASVTLTNNRKLTLLGH